jgi:2-polyprenyl-3-methyl-5-hydroxy-6-metoxy-1,4-benzoquinol methylase
MHRALNEVLARVLDVGCRSGLLARKLLDAGFAVHGVDASPAMIGLAHDDARGADFDAIRSPTGLAAGTDGASSG